MLFLESSLRPLLALLALPGHRVTQSDVPGLVPAHCPETQLALGWSLASLGGSKLLLGTTSSNMVRPGTAEVQKSWEPHLMLCEADT